MNKLTQPEGVPNELRDSIRHSVFNSPPLVADPGLIKSAGRATGLYVLPAPLVVAHVYKRRHVEKASEAEISCEVEYLVDYFMECCSEHRALAKN